MRVYWKHIYVDRRKQRKRAKKGDNIFPTVAPELVLITYVIDLIERNVKIMDTPDAQLSTDTDEDLVMIIEERPVKLITILDM